MVTPVGIGGVQDRGAMLTGSRDGDEFTVGPIEACECGVIREFVEIVNGVIARGDFDELALFGICLVFQNPF